MFSLQEIEQKGKQTQRTSERQSQKDVNSLQLFISPQHVTVCRESFMQSHYVKCGFVTCGIDSNDAHNGTVSTTVINLWHQFHSKKNQSGKL